MKDVKKNDFILKVYGTGPLEDELIREYSSENIIFYGEVDNDIVIDAISKARAVITSTKYMKVSLGFFVKHQALAFLLFFPHLEAWLNSFQIIINFHLNNLIMTTY